MSFNEKSSLLSAEEIASHIRSKVDNPVYWVNDWLIDFSTELSWVAQFQDVNTKKWFIGQLERMLSPNASGGQYQLDNRDWQILKELTK